MAANKGKFSLAALFAVASVTLLGMLGGVALVYGSSSNTITATATVNGVCAINIQSGGSINFFPSGAVPGQTTTAAGNQVVTANNLGSNIAANILVEGSAWTGTGSNTLGVSNTVWDGTSGTTYSNSIALTGSLVDTGVVLQTPSISSPSKSNTIYFGLGIPEATPADTYTQTITLDISC
jgi:hypothetical protein